MQLARPDGFEPPTPRFVVWCSIQLSYGRVFRMGRESVPKTSKAAGNAPLAIGFGPQWQGSGHEVRAWTRCRCTRVARGLDPWVHRSSQEVFAKKMDGRVKPGNDAARAVSASSRPCPLAAPRVEIDRAIRNRQAEGRADGAFDQADLAAVGAHQLGHDGEPEPDAAGAGRALEGFEQMRAGLLPESRAGVGDLDHHHRALAPARTPDLIAAGVLGVARLERLHGGAREIEHD